MRKLARIALVLATVSTTLVVGSGAAHATRCNDNDKDLYAGDPALVFAGVNNDPWDDSGVCVRALGQGADAHVPIFSAEPQPGLHLLSAGVIVCTVNVFSGPEPCVWPSGSVTLNTNQVQVDAGTMACTDVAGRVCVSGNAGAGRVITYYQFCVETPAVIRCEASPNET